MHNTVILALTVVLLSTASLYTAGANSTEPLVLVVAGKSLAPIVVAADAAPWTLRSAGELADYLAKISDARPEVIVGLPEPMPDKAIWVGVHPALADLLPDLDLDFRHPEAIVIAATPKHLVIAGRDIWDPNLPSVRGRFDSEVTDWQQEYGTVNAVYTFLQDYLDVRWLWPGELGEDLVKRDTIAFAPFTFRFHPPFRLRSGLFLFSALGDNRGRGGSHDWARRQRLQLDSSREGTSTRQGDSIGGHAFGKWWGRFHEPHPEYFALQPDGTRSGFPSPGNAKLCQSNPAVVAQWLADVEDMLAREPDRTIFNVSPNDGHSSGICVCEHCIARDNPEGQPWQYQWRGLAQSYVAMSDRYLTFANETARALRTRFPDRDDAYVLLHGYGPSTPPPVGLRADDNVMIGYVGFFPLAGNQTRQAQKENWAGWARKSSAMVYRPNLWYFGGGVLGLPEVALAETAEDFRFLADHNCFGFSVDYCAEHWGTMLPQYYLMARLGWDPHADADAIMADWYRRGFGPAANAIDAYWTLLNQASRDVMAHPEHGEGSRFTFSNAGVMQEIFNPDLLARAEAKLDRAAAQTADAPEVFRLRVAFVRDGFEFVSLMYRAAGHMAQVRASDGRDADAVRAVIAAWADIDALAKRNPLSINHTYVTHRMQGGYGGGVRDFFGPPKQEFLQAAGLIKEGVLDMRHAAGQQGFLRSAGLTLREDASGGN